MSTASNLILILVAILLPPASVIIMSGCCTCDLIINIALTILGYIPGHIHAFYLIYKKSKAEEQYGLDNVEYLGNGDYRPKYGGGQAQPPLGTHTYGTINNA